MKRSTLEATDENVMESIKYNTYNRSRDVSDFIEGLDLIDGNVFISLDARWGEGKTFFVRQVEMTLKYLLDKDNGKVNAEIVEYFRPNPILNSIELKNAFLPIYYNAWLYDNHDDPLLSLLFVLVKECGKFIDTKFDNETIGNKLLSLIDSVQISLGVITLPEISKIKERFEGKDLLESIKTSEDIRKCIKDILDSIITESVSKLVIFIDELDRCKPSFAIEMLERIKHYYDDERIIFISSVNKEQLVHTILNYYGNNFDSTAYLNKFFDYDIRLPEIDKNYTIDYLGNNGQQFALRNIASSLASHYRLSLRDSIIYKSSLADLPIKYVNDSTIQGNILSVFVPIIKILSIVNIDMEKEFSNGNKNIFTDLASNIGAIREVMYRFGESDGEKTEQSFRIGFDKFLKVYNAMFMSKNFIGYNGELDVNENIIKICIKLCNRY